MPTVEELVDQAISRSGYEFDVARSPTDPEPGPITILVVDDEPAVLSTMVELLELSGYQAVPVNDAERAVTTALTARPDLVLLDVLMPGIDGLTLAQRLRSQPDLADVPIIFLSALADSDTTARSFAAGGVDFLVKPYRVEELLARVRTHLDLHLSRRALAARQEDLTERIAESSARHERSRRELERRNAELDTLLATLPDAVFLKDPDGVYLTCNPRAADRYGSTVEEVIGRTDADLLPGPVAAQLQENDRRAVELGRAHHHEEVVPGPDGAGVLYETVRTPMYDPRGTLIGVVGVARDITERRSYEEALELERTRLGDALEAAAAATWEWDLPRDLLRVSDRWERIQDLDTDGRGAVECSRWLARVHPDDARMVSATLEVLAAGRADSHQHEYRVRLADGRMRWIRDLCRVSERHGDGSIRLVRGMSFDITREKAHVEELTFAAQHDGLTGLSNRGRFAEVLRDELHACQQTGRAMAVVCFDLDGFEAVNATHGRAGGNQLLVELAGRLLDYVGERHRVARTGGDEFAVMLTGLSDREAWRGHVEELYDVVTRPVALQGRPLHATASIGITLVPQARNVDAEQLLRQADQAVYHAKLAGKDRYHLFDPEHDAARREHFQLVDEVHQALSEDQFVLQYQPQVNMRTGEVVGVEALIRWEHPQRGLLPPGVFIPPLIGHPLSIEIGDWVIEEALAQVDRWNDEDLRTTVSVNLDTAQLYDPDFVERLQDQLAAHPRVRPQQLGIEILETGALEDLDHVAALVHRVRALGVAVSLDDFGTGYSSLTLLKQLAADTIKIDRSFVLGLLTDAEQAVIIDSVVTLMRNFQRSVLAEGVETEEHGRLLLELGCELGQGYGIGRPMPAHAFPAWLEQWTPPLSWARTASLPEDRIPWVMAELEHRAWQEQLQGYLTGELAEPPKSDEEQCRLGRWLGRTSSQQLPQREALVIQHRQLHAAAAELVAARRSGAEPLTITAMEQVRQTSQTLVEALRFSRSQYLT